LLNDNEATSLKIINSPKKNWRKVNGLLRNQNNYIRAIIARKTKIMSNIKSKGYLFELNSGRNITFIYP
jgi:hypothetical protein